MMIDTTHGSSSNILPVNYNYMQLALLVPIIHFPTTNIIDYLNSAHPIMILHVVLWSTLTMVIFMMC